MTTDSRESGLSRWSRRKIEAKQAESTSQPPPPAEHDAVQAPVVAESETPLTDADMPPIESLTEDSDFSGFMSAGVSDELRNLALRKLFMAPVFNIRDGLDEYDEDYTKFEKLGDIVTADMKHQIEIQQQKLREKLATEGEIEAESADLESVEEIDDEIVDDEAPEPQAVNLARAESAIDIDGETDNEQ